MARPKGFEPLTSAFGGQYHGFVPICSKQIEIEEVLINPLFLLEYAAYVLALTAKITKAESAIESTKCFIVVVPGQVPLL